MFRNHHHPFRPRIGLALGGGGARGFAHLGVLQAFEEHHIPIDFICGTSMGAIIGALYAREPDARAVRREVLNLLESDILKSSGIQLTQKLERISRNKILGPPVEQLVRFYRLFQYATRDHLMQDETIREALSMLFDEDLRIEDLALPFASVAVDLITGERVIFDRGPLRRSVLASASIPGIFSPVQWHEQRLVDGAVLSLVPISAAYALGADLVIAVDVSPVFDRSPKLNAASDILLRCDDLLSRAFNALRLSEADVVLTPIKTDSSWSDFGRVDEFVRAGYAGTISEMKNLKRAVGFPGNWLRLLRRKIRARSSWADGPVPTRLESSSAE
ncbi:MAG: patatin-like phospholipase family protein [Candidatus Eisenbacteria sp.]|nr:patatin-like phospholipase family protein [Candidatus Eisenbacteria bacterium]